MVVIYRFRSCTYLILVSIASFSISQGNSPDLLLYAASIIDTSTWTKKSTKGNPPTASSIKGLYRAGKIITFGGIQEKHAINSVFSLDLC